MGYLIKFKGVFFDSLYLRKQIRKRLVSDKYKTMGFKFEAGNPN